MLKNQFPLTEGVRANQKAITQGFDQLQWLADIKELPDEGWERDWMPEPPDLEKNFDGDEIKLLKYGNFPRPSKFNETNPQGLEQKLLDLNDNIKEINGRITGRRIN